MIKFNLDKEVSLSSYEQIKGQLLSAIYCGKIKEGDRLPSIREVAEDLGVNYKTIRKIYIRLAEDDYVANLLRAENDETMNQSLVDLPADDRLEETRRIMHKDLHRH